LEELEEFLRNFRVHNISSFDFISGVYTSRLIV